MDAATEYFGMTTGRIHYLLSDLEANVFHVFFCSFVTDIREQFPLHPIDEILAIATDLGITHPQHPVTKCPVVMTTDQLLTVSYRKGSIYWARGIKYSGKLSNLRVLEKLEIERRYWQACKIEWRIVRECDVPKELVSNIKWVRPYFRLADLYPLTKQVVRSVAPELTRRVLQDDAPLVEIAHSCDHQHGLPSGSCLALSRHLLATQAWRANLRNLINPGRPLKLLAVDPHLASGRWPHDRN